jgi:uncharacterized protein (UPF0218 family)
METHNTVTLTPIQRQELKKPLGKLIKGSPKQAMKKIEKLLQKEKPNQIISVGDIVTQNLIKNEVPIHVMIIDNKVQRQQIQPIKVEAEKTLHIKNPPGTIATETWTIIQQALGNEQTTKILVDGEEDLLAIVAVIQAPANSLVIYGQPHEGIVTMKVTAETKKRMRKIIEEMQSTVEKSK